jgi:peptide/nickel transport system substrate-binding protein
MASDRKYWDGLHLRRLSRRRLLGSGAAVAATAGLAACGSKPAASGSKPAVSSAAQGTPVRGGTLNIATDVNPPLNPLTNARVTTMDAIGGVMSRLLRFKAGLDPKVYENWDVEGDLATSVESPDGVTWTAKLRPDAVFQNVSPVNGHPVEAEDIKQSLVHLATDPRNANRDAIGMIDPNGITTPDAHTVVFKLKYPYAPFNKTLASGSYCWIFPREAFGGAYDPEKQVIGSGPFLFESATPDVGLVYKRNPSWWWNKDMPYIDGIQYSIVPDPNQALAQFTSGHLDVLAPLPTEVDSAKAQNPKATFLTTTPADCNWVFGQLGDPKSVWSDIRVRQAVSMAIDRAAFAKAAAPQGGEDLLVVQAYYGPWTLKLSDLDANTAQWYKYNPAESKKLLQAAGLQDFTFKFVYPSTGYGDQFVKNAQTVNSMLGAAGFKTTLVPIDYQREWVNNGKGVRYGAIGSDSFGWALTAGYNDPDEVLYNYFYSTSALSNTKLKDPKLDAMIDKERTALTDDARRQAVLDIQKYLAQQLYFVGGLAFPYNYHMRQARVQNYYYTLDYGFMTATDSRLWLLS